MRKILSRIALSTIATFTSIRAVAAIEEETGVPVTVAFPESLQDKFQQVAVSAWSWNNFERKVDYGVAVLPKLNDKPSEPFVGILSTGISSASPNHDLAVEFIENYLMTNQGLQMVDQDEPLGAVALKSFQRVLENDSRIKATMQNAEAGEIMPNVTNMNAFWHAEGNAIQNVVGGRASVEKALNTAAKQMLN